MKKALLCLGMSLLFAVGGCSQKDSLSPEAAREQTDSRLKQLTLATMRYAQRHNSIYPDMSSADALKKDLTPYLHEDSVGGEEIFVQADTGEPFQPNPAASHQDVVRFFDKPNKVLIYQASASPNDTRAVAFNDAKTRRIGESDWKEIKPPTS